MLARGQVFVIGPHRPRYHLRLLLLLLQMLWQQYRMIEISTSPIRVTILVLVQDRDLAAGPAEATAPLDAA